MSIYPTAKPLSTCINCGATAHEFCTDDCPETYRPDPDLTDCEVDR
jgi:hypothetical protein